jgi:putative FmdB family regulatory protein
VPTYQYACTECGDRHEVVQSFSDDPLAICGVCGGRLRKVFSPVGIVFKGSGFYRNDSRSTAVNGSGGKDRVNAGSDGSSSSSDGDSGGKSESAKSDSGAASESGSKAKAGSKSESGSASPVNGGNGAGAGAKPSTSRETGSKVA